MRQDSKDTAAASRPFRRLRAALSALRVGAEELRALPESGAARPRRIDIVRRALAAAFAALRKDGRVDEPHPEADAVRVTLDVNGVTRTLSIEPRVTLLDALRDNLGLTGAKKGCDHGQCGACTVLSDGRSINACMTLAIMQQGKRITTIEGLADGEELHPLQASFIEHDAFQGGFCTPGQIMSAAALFAKRRALAPAEIREHMSGNICRCGAYDNIVAAVKAAQGRG